ncbi:MAG: DUF3788 domain-containing protein [Candidatus Marinimicrobia bacterium]|nr:DUF3788 domain-containing protein [Candidatus Neomarinimicrobiota bacterium]MCF7923299.1 DUF3788 domain-containing protein [Candidatus Neomarinimicrobiota bacterium]
MSITELSDPERFPTEEIIFSIIGDSREYWETLFGLVESEHPEFACEWRYYNDGKRWLLKTVKKSKTIFWLSIIQNSFRITFYFGDKAEPQIVASAISQRLRDSFVNGKKFGKIRAISLQIENENDVEDLRKLIELKLKIK